MQKIADLHVHTNFSDGTFTPKETFEFAKKKGLGCIAIADHDSVSAISAGMDLQTTYGIELIPAVEMTAQDGKKELHMLGYCIDWKNEELIKKLKQICDGRIERVYKMVEKLRQHGIDADADEIINNTKGRAVSRLHIAKYLVEKGLVSSLQIVFNNYIGDDRPCYVSRFRFSTVEIIDAIKRSGGVAVIAHPGLNRVSELLPALVKNGLDGIEVFHSDHPYSATRKLKKFALANDLLITGGSDCHGLNKRKILMGDVKLPYEYVEKMKEYAQKRRHR